MRELRRDAGWTQEDLARLAGVTKRSIGSYERDGIPLPSVARIDEVFGGELLGRPKPETLSWPQSDVTALMIPSSGDVAVALGPLVNLLDQVVARLEALEKTAGRAR